MSNEPSGSDNHEGKKQVVSDEDLDTALDTLQSILESRRVVPDQSSTGPQHPEPSWQQERETLPLLDEVVLPGSLVEDGETDSDEAPDPTEPMEPMPPYGDLINRLASELDVIIESCVEEALGKAKQELMVHIKQHLDIVLPEILYELVKRQAED